MTRGHTLVPVWALVALVACASGGPIPRATGRDVARAQLADPDASLASLEHGRGLYLARCASCHQPFAPDSRSLDEWHLEVAEMRARSGIDPTEERLILAYLGTFSRR